MKHTFVRCIICGIPYVDKEDPYLCEPCQANGTAAEAIKRLNTETDNAADRIVDLEAAKAEALGLIRTLALLESKDGSRTYPSKAACEAAREWLEKYGS